MTFWDRHRWGLRVAGVSPPRSGTCQCPPWQGEIPGSPGSDLLAPPEVVSQREPSVQLTP